MMNLPNWLMYKHTWIDSQHQMWLPRWGYSQKQMIEAEERANELYNNIFEKENKCELK